MLRSCELGEKQASSVTGGGAALKAAVSLVGSRIRPRDGGHRVRHGIQPDPPGENRRNPGMPEEGSPPVSTSSNRLSTLHRRFACARLSQPCLTGSGPDVSATLPSRPGEFHPEPLTGGVEDWRAGWGRSISTLPRFQPPPRRTQHADFPHCAPPFASRRGLLDLSCRGDFRSVASHSIAVEQP